MLLTYIYIYIYILEKVVYKIINIKYKKKIYITTNIMQNFFFLFFNIIF